MNHVFIWAWDMHTVQYHVLYSFHRHESLRQLCLLVEFQAQELG